MLTLSHSHHFVGARFEESLGGYLLNRYKIVDNKI